MIGSGGSFSNIQVLLTANNASLKSVLAQSSAGIKAFDKTVAKSNTNLSKTGKLLGKTLAGGAMAAAAGMVYAVSKTVEFDKAMRNVNSLANLGAKDFLALEQRVISMSTKLPQSATILAEGLYDIQSSGFEGAEAMAVLEASALSASAGLTTTEVSARAISAVLNAYGLEARSAADVSDVLFQTVNAGVISFDELAGNLGDVVGGAAAAKVEIDEVGSAIAAMTLAGIGGAEATTSLNALLQKIIQPSKALSEMYGELGYESGASALEADGLRGVMDKLRTATGGNITTLLQLFPEIRAARGALALMANEGQNYARTAGQIEDKNARAGAAQRVFNEQMKAAANQFSLLKNQADAAAIGLGMALLPALFNIMDGTREVGTAIGDLLGVLNDAFGPGISDLGKILADLWNIFGDLAANVWALVEPFAKLGIGAVAETFNLLMSVIEPLTGALADNEAAVIALAAAWAVFAAGGVAKVASILVANIFVAAAVAIHGVTGALGKMSASLAAARGAMIGFMAAAAPIAAVAAVVYMAVGGWQAYSKAVEETEASLESLADAQESGTVGQLKSEVDSLKKLVKERKEAIDEYGSKDFGTIVKNLNPVRWDDQFAIEEYKNSIKEIEDGAETGQAALEGFGAGVASLATEMGLVDPDEAARLIKAFSEGDPAALEDLDGLLAQIQPKMAEAGVSARILQQALQSVSLDENGNLDTASLEGVIGMLDRTTSAGSGTARSQEDVKDAFLAASSGATDAATAADSLKEALDGLTGSAMSVDAAGIEWRQGLHDLTGSLRETGGGIKGNSLAAGENRLAIQGAVEKMQDLLVAQARNGAGADELSASLGRSRAALIKAGEAADIPAASMKTLLRQYKLTPALVQTLIKEHGGKGVRGILRALKGEADDLGRKKPKVVIGVTDTSAKQKLADSRKRLIELGIIKPVMKPGADTKGAMGKLEALLDQAKSTDKQDVDIPTAAPGAALAKQQLDAARQAAVNADGTTATITTVHETVRKTSKQADGGYYPAFADGGFAGEKRLPGVSRLPQQAQVQPGVGRGLIQWAEGETGGEAFIPLSSAKRARSEEILAQVASKFGLQLSDTEEMESYANGGFPGFRFNYKPFRFRRRGKKEKAAAYAKDRAAAKREYEREKRQAKFDQLQEWRERRRLWGVSQGQGEGQFVADPSGNAQATLGSMEQAAEARARATAELQARRSKNPNDTADDFYKKPILTIKDYVKALQAASAAASAWGRSTSKIASTVGADVVAQLQGMGEDGEKWIKKLATSSVADMRKMAAELRKIQYMEFQNGLTQDIAAQSQFAANLALLISQGRGDLAAQFGEMGYQNAGGLAATAVTMTSAQQAALAGQMQTQDDLSDPAMLDAINLSGVLTKAGRPLGIIGLSAASGKGVADVVGLLQRYKSQVFDKMPADKLAQIRADQELLRQGKQPSGLAMGGIVGSGQTSDSLYYRWAEKGSGGESLIPHGRDKRGRAMAIWEQTGRILGAHSLSGGGGSMVVVQPGAVVVDIDASGQGMTVGELERIARSASNEAMQALTQKLQSGRK